jgi:hypothetical protein
MTISFFLGKVIGIYLFTTSLALVLNKKIYKDFLKEIAQNSSFIIFSGIIALILGIMIITTHNVWMMKWEVIITIIGWITFIKGVLFLYFPTSMLHMIKHLYKKTIFITICSWIGLFIGIYLIYMSF